MNIDCFQNDIGPSGIHGQRRDSDHHSNDNNADDDSDPMERSDHESSDMSDHPRPKRIVKMTERARYLFVSSIDWPADTSDRHMDTGRGVRKLNAHFWQR